jgi:hypothetical protein
MNAAVIIAAVAIVAIVALVFLALWSACALSGQVDERMGE